MLGLVLSVVSSSGSSAVLNLTEKSLDASLYCFERKYILREAYEGTERLKCFEPRSRIIFSSKDSYTMVTTNKCLGFSLDLHTLV